MCAAINSAQRRTARGVAKQPPPNFITNILALPSRFDVGSFVHFIETGEKNEDEREAYLIEIARSRVHNGFVELGERKMKGAVSLLVIAVLLTGCVEVEKKRPLPPPFYYKPRIFEDGRMLVNPYRERKTIGPSFGYRLFYDEMMQAYRMLPSKRDEWEVGEPGGDLYEPIPFVVE